MDLFKEKMKPGKAAVVVVDVQNDFCHPDGALAKRGADVSVVQPIIPHLNRLFQAARTYHVPILFIQLLCDTETDSEAVLMRTNGKPSTVCRRGTWGMEFYEISPQPGDIVIHKHKYSAFMHTKLDAVLRSLKIETLIVTGVSTNVCVESTAREGFMMDYHIVVVEDGCTSLDGKDAHNMTLKNIEGYFGKVFTVDQVIETWASAEV